jgi:hypothetical protein
MNMFHSDVKSMMMHYICLTFAIESNVGMGISCHDLGEGWSMSDTLGREISTK